MSMSTKLTPKELLEEHHYCVISMATKDASPWLTPVFYAYDAAWNLYWISSKNSYHSRIFLENSKACAVIYRPPSVAQEVSALYLTGQVIICQDEVLKQAMPIYFERAGLGVSGKADDYCGDNPCRLYRLKPEQAFSLMEPEWDENLLLDKRGIVELPEQ